MKKKTLITLVLLFGINSSFADAPKNVTCVDTTTGNSYRFGISENWMEFKLNGQENYQSCKTTADHIENKVLGPKDYKTLSFFSISEKSSKLEHGGLEMLHFECKDAVSGEESESPTVGIFVDYSPMASILTINGKLPFSTASFGYSAVVSADSSRDRIDNTSDSTVVCEGLIPSNFKYPNFYRLKK